MHTMPKINLVLLLAFGFTASLSAQVICLPGFPTADSPVQSFSPDDIPSTNDHIMTYTGSHVAARANHTVSFLQISPNEQKVWFFPDNSTIDTAHTYYNRRYRADLSSPWYWEFSISPSIIAGDSLEPSSVLYSPTPKYVDTRTNTSYSYIMYQLAQPSTCFPGNASPSLGYLYVAFSNDGICWTNTQLATRLGGPFAPCIGASNTVPIEAMTAFDGADSGGLIRLIGVEGDATDLANRENMSKTMTYIGFATPSNPSNVYLNDPPFIVDNGVVSPTAFYPSYYTSYIERYQPYHYFFNLQGAYDPSSGDLYLARAYPYPFDRGSKDWNDNPQSPGVVPQAWQGQQTFMLDPATGRSVMVAGCKESPQTLPNRIQLYKMHIGSLLNFSTLGDPNSYWTLLADLGNASGYSNWVTGALTTPITYWPQTNAGRDYASVSFLRDGQGNLIRENGVASYFAGDSFELSKSNGPCQVTGLERETVLAVP